MGPAGYIGFFLRTTDANLQVGIGLDDGVSGGSTGLEVSTSLSVIADGRWHLYEWNLADANQWSNFSGGNGAIGGPNAYIDSIFLYADPGAAGSAVSVMIDTVAYNPSGSLAALASNLPADFSGNHRVDAGDLVLWQSHFAASAIADADGDGASDGADFLQWQRHVGSVPALAAALVPEPHAVALAVSTLLAAVSRRQRSFCHSAAPLPNRP
jgi:hypothetical protein